MFRISLPLAAFLGVWLGASHALAHITLIEPAPRTSQQKEGPCGTTGLARGETVAVFEPGETITIMWAETVDHDSHYRVALDLDGDDDLVAPDGDDDLYNSPTVLIDGIHDDVGGRYTQDVILPDVECERCVLQLIQVMYGRGNYFQCADIAIRRGAGPPPPPPPIDAGPGGDGGADAGPTDPPPMVLPPDAETGPDAGAGGPGPAAAPGDPTGHAYGGCDASGSSPGAPLGLLIAFMMALRCTARTRRPRSRPR